MQDIFITGHRNPDMDSVCSSWAYAQYKNTIDPSSTYHAIRCGHLNNQTRHTLQEIGIKAPRLEKDVFPRVKDILVSSPRVLSADAPVLDAVKAIHDFNISVIPLMQDDGSYAGLVSVNEVSDFLMAEQIGGRPRYSFNTENFDKVLPGFCYKRGEKSRFKGPLMVGAMPFETSVNRIKELLPEKPILVVGQRAQIIEYAVEQQFPALILTGIKEPKDVQIDLKDFRGTVFVSRIDTAETVRRLRLSIPVMDIMKTEYPELKEDDHFDDAKKRLVNSDIRGLPVFSADEDHRFLGVVTRRCFIERPRRQVIMVDHNEAAQSIRGIEHADINEIIDHHRLGAEKTRSPIYIAAKPVGSTCTIVHQHYLQAGLSIDKTTALVLLAGILSDTVVLKSPTTTAEDRQSAVQLANTAGTTVEEFGGRIFSHTAVLSDQKPEEVIKADFKEYHEFSFRIGIGQVEVPTFQDLDEVMQDYLNALKHLQAELRMDWTMLLISNVLKEQSKLLCTSFPTAEDKLVFKKEEQGLFDLPEILSRKKQVLPEILRVLEEVKGEQNGT